VGKALLQVMRTWGNERVQWGQPIGKHEAVSKKIAHCAADTFAMEAIGELACALYEKGNYDIRLEAAIAKMWNTEAGWRLVDDTLQVRGGRGYETAASLAARGETPIPIERAMRDFRINLIFEGSSEIMRLFIAREAVDHHFKTAFALVAPESNMGERAAAATRVAKFYPAWYAARWIGKGQLPVSYASFGKLAKHLRFIERNTRHLGRSIFHAMVRFGPKLERRQLVLFRAVDIGAELFAMSAVCVRAKADDRPEAYELAEAFCAQAQVRITELFERMWHNTDDLDAKLAKQVLAGRYTWQEEGVIDPSIPGPWIAAAEPGPSEAENVHRTVG
jgi:hypothetical protein